MKFNSSAALALALAALLPPARPAPHSPCAANRKQRRADKAMARRMRPTLDADADRACFYAFLEAKSKG